LKLTPVSVNEKDSKVKKNKDEKISREISEIRHTLNNLDDKEIHWIGGFH